jgi:hypothetical protein
MNEEKIITNSINEFMQLLTKLNQLINEIESTWNRYEVSEIAKKELDLESVRNAMKNLNDFVVFPEKVRDPGRPVKFPDSKEEKGLFKKFRGEGLSLRSISDNTGMSKDMVDRKLKRYGIK